MRNCFVVRLSRTSVLLLAIFVVALGGCGHSGSLDPSAGTPGPAASPEEVARVMVEALKSGDVETFLAHTDLYGIYMQFPAPMRRTFSFEYFKGLVEKAKAKVGDADLNEFKTLSYEILGVEERDGCSRPTSTRSTASGSLPAAACGACARRSSHRAFRSGARGRA
jgi:hypothetical protein